MRTSAIPPEMATAPGYFLRRLQQAYQAAWSLHVDSVVTSPQLAVLLAVGRNPGVEQGLIGNSVALDRSTMTGVVDRLESRGWLKKRRSSRDGRKRLLYLSPDGRKVMAETMQRSKQLEDLLMEGYGPEGRLLVIAMLSQLAEYWEAVANNFGAQEPNIDEDAADPDPTEPPVDDVGVS
ncbi:MarR family winged helix-turn-helix transcriptional regulator [Pseudonocardia sulfidoxydans]|uniref:MarR family winged helix-turn-helix transcriptional regulator n=1 Tax=Pseudonocardia sulfidoxydans TaxID=54011 RepID=UPI001C9A155E|nr:MarR family transcriptional regulator [Pseudonocardia sulfidoxydans]